MSDMDREPKEGLAEMLKDIGDGTLEDGPRLEEFMERWRSFIELGPVFDPEMGVEIVGKLRNQLPEEDQAKADFLLMVCAALHKKDREGPTN